MGTNWTEQEKQLLIDNYPLMTTKELMETLNKTSGQIRGMKTKLGLKGKFKPFTDEEKDIIRTYYLNNKDAIDLDILSERINRPKTSISRFAKTEGLTNNKRSASEKAVEKSKKNAAKYRETEKYKNDIYPKQCEQLRYYAQNAHPKGMLGKHHAQSACKKISDFQLSRSANMTSEEKHNIAMKAVKTKMTNGTLSATTSNAYSRTKGGKRKDLNEQYFRSSWEANVARIFNFLNIKWEYEYKRFIFESNDNGICSYQPDFYLPKLNAWIEVKGWMDNKSKTRLRLFAEQYPEEYQSLILIDEPFYNILNNTYSNLEHWEEYSSAKRSLDDEYFMKLDSKQEYFMKNIFLIHNN